MIPVASPKAQPVYSANEEQVFRDLVIRGFQAVVPKTGLPNYPGAQTISAKGTNATFSAPNGATTYIPLETIQYDTNNRTLSLSPHKIKAPYSGFAMVSAIIDNVSTGTGAANNDVNFKFYKNGSLVDTNTFQLNTTNAWRLNLTGYMTLVKDDEITLYVDHNKVSAFTFDLTKSSLTLIMLSPNPTYIDRTRI